MTSTIRTRYVQAAIAQKWHIVPLVGNRVAKTTLCNKTVKRWQSLTDEPPTDCCVRCAKVYEARGWARALQIVRAAGDSGRQRRG